MCIALKWMQHKFSKWCFLNFGYCQRNACILHNVWHGTAVRKICFQKASMYIRIVHEFGVNGNVCLLAACYMSICSDFQLIATTAHVSLAYAINENQKLSRINRQSPRCAYRWIQPNVRCCDEVVSLTDNEQLYIHKVASSKQNWRSKKKCLVITSKAEKKKKYIKLYMPHGYYYT